MPRQFPPEILNTHINTRVIRDITLVKQAAARSRFVARQGPDAFRSLNIPHRGDDLVATLEKLSHKLQANAPRGADDDPR